MYVKPLPARPDLEQYRTQAKELQKARQASDSAPSTLADAQFTIAREHGFDSWPKFAKHITGLRQGPVRHFEQAADAIVDGDLDLLTTLLRDHPGLATERSTRSHHATLLHYVSANGVEDFRQRTPGNIVPITRLLLRSGAAPDATSQSYGGEDTTLGLVVSSDHPGRAGQQVGLVDALVDFGAAVNGIHDDAEPLVTALAFRWPLAADALVRRGARIDTVLTAAGMGRLDVVRGFLSPDGTPRTGVRLAKMWPRLPRDPQRHVERALIWAATFGHADVVDFLCAQRIDQGAVDQFGFTALHWAAIRGHVDVVDLLVRRGLPLERRDNQYDSTVLGGAVWAARNEPAAVDIVQVVKRLIAAGADVSVVPGVDDVIHRDP